MGLLPPVFEGDTMKIGDLVSYSGVSYGLAGKNVAGIVLKIDPDYPYAIVLWNTGLRISVRVKRLKILNDL